MRLASLLSCVSVSALLLAGCYDRSWQSYPFASEVKTRGAKISGFGPVTFGTSRDDALASLAGQGQWIDMKGQDKPVLFWREQQGSYEFDAWAYFDKKSDKVSRIELISVNALQGAGTHDQCQQMYGLIKTAIEGKYGEPDQAPRHKRDGRKETSTAIYTFSDSSSVRMLYEFNDVETSAEPKCKVKITYNQAWAS